MPTAPRGSTCSDLRIPRSAAGKSSDPAAGILSEVFATIGPERTVCDQRLEHLRALRLLDIE
jgi:hypothetical protein